MPILEFYRKEIMRGVNRTSCTKNDLTKLFKTQDNRNKKNEYKISK